MTLKIRGIRAGIRAALVLALSHGLACQIANPRPGPAPAQLDADPRPAWRGYVADHWLPGPWTPRFAGSDPSVDRSALEARCRGCHVEIAHEWDRSEHAGAWSSDAFQAAFAREPLRFCQGCHAPEVAPEAGVGVPEWAAAIGVGCVTCHVEPGSERIWSASVSPAAPHPVAASPAFAGPQACARCHEFEFPDARLRERPLLMQSTIREHAASAFADRSCADCHMPRNPAGQRSHSFPGAYAPELLAQAVRVTATREPERVRFRLDPGAVGHAVPTGDLLRRLELRVEVVAADGTTSVLGRRWFGRWFGPIHQRDGLTVRGQLDDTRIGPAGVDVELAIPPGARALPLRWTLSHQRVAHAAAEPSGARLEGQIEFAYGVVPAP
jgi:hypothetical protein